MEFRYQDILQYTRQKKKCLNFEGKKAKTSNIYNSVTVYIKQKFKI